MALLKTNPTIGGWSQLNIHMGQLEAYTIQDIYLVAIMSGVLSTYFAEEIEATIESVVSYLYSANQTTKKKLKFLVQEVPAGDLIGAMHTSQNFLGVAKLTFIVIEKPLDDRPI
jgi:hypothetical protein